MSFVRDGVDDVRQVARGWRWGRRGQVPRSAEPFVPPAESTVFGTEWARRGPGRAAREVAQKAGLEPVFRSQVKTRVEGLDVLDRVQGPVLFVANHASHLDTPLVLLSLPDAWRRRTAVAAAADYFFDTWWRAVGSALLFNTFPIERRSGSMSDTPGDVLADGWSLLIFPEGTRSTDGWMGRFRLGAAYLACEHGVPVVPVAHRGTFAAMPRGPGLAEPRPPAADDPVRRTGGPRPRRDPAQLRATDPGRRRRPDGRGRDDLVGRTEAGGHRVDARPGRSGRRALAEGLGADRIAPPRARSGSVADRGVATLRRRSPDADVRQVRTGPIREAPGSESGVTRVPPARAGEWAARPSGRPEPPGGVRARGNPAPPGARTAPVLLLAAVLITACGGSAPGTATDPPPSGNELTEHGEPCPGALVAEPPDQRPAETAPDLSGGRPGVGLQLPVRGPGRGSGGASVTPSRSTASSSTPRRASSMSSSPRHSTRCAPPTSVRATSSCSPRAATSPRSSWTTSAATACG